MSKYSGGGLEPLRLPPPASSCFDPRPSKYAHDEREDSLPRCSMCGEAPGVDRGLASPCSCGYQACTWCWQHINERMGGSCPGCADPDPYGSSNSLGAMMLSGNSSSGSLSSAAVDIRRSSGRPRRGSDDYDPRDHHSYDTDYRRGDRDLSNSSGGGASGHARSYASEPGGAFAEHHQRSSSSSSLTSPGMGPRRYGPTSAPPPPTRTLSGSSFGGTSERARAANRRNLQHLRVIQRNLVYVIGLSPTTSAAEAASPRFFGQYGRISKIVVNHHHGVGHEDPRHGSASAYVTFAYKEDAWSAIKAVDGFWLDGRHVRASFGTTKYCNSFLRGLPCNNSDCLYLHELGDERDRFTKEEIQAGLARHGSSFAFRDEFRGSGTYGRPSGTGVRSHSPVLPPPASWLEPRASPPMQPRRSLPLHHHHSHSHSDMGGAVHGGGCACCEPANSSSGSSRDVLSRSHGEMPPGLQPPPLAYRSSSMGSLTCSLSGSGGLSSSSRGEWSSREASLYGSSPSLQSQQQMQDVYLAREPQLQPTAQLTATAKAFVPQSPPLVPQQYYGQGAPVQHYNAPPADHQQQQQYERDTLPYGEPSSSSSTGHGLVRSFSSSGMVPSALETTHEEALLQQQRTTPSPLLRAVSEPGSASSDYDKKAAAGIDDTVASTAPPSDAANDNISVGRKSSADAGDEGVLIVAASTDSGSNKVTSGGSDQPSSGEAAQLSIGDMAAIAFGKAGKDVRASPPSNPLSGLSAIWSAPADWAGSSPRKPPMSPAQQSVPSSAAPSVAASPIIAGLSLGAPAAGSAGKSGVWQASLSMLGGGSSSGGGNDVHTLSGGHDLRQAYSTRQGILPGRNSPPNGAGSGYAPAARSYGQPTAPIGIPGGSSSSSHNGNAEYGGSNRSSIGSGQGSSYSSNAAAAGGGMSYGTPGTGGGASSNFSSGSGLQRGENHARSRSWCGEEDRERGLPPPHPNTLVHRASFSCYSGTPAAVYAAQQQQQQGGAYRGAGGYEDGSQQRQPLSPTGGSSHVRQASYGPSAAQLGYKQRANSEDYYMGSQPPSPALTPHAEHQHETFAAQAQLPRSSSDAYLYQQGDAHSSVASSYDEQQLHMQIAPAPMQQQQQQQYFGSAQQHPINEYTAYHNGAEQPSTAPAHGSGDSEHAVQQQQRQQWPTAKTPPPKMPQLVASPHLPQQQQQRHTLQYGAQQQQQHDEYMHSSGNGDSSGDWMRRQAELQA